MPTLLHSVFTAEVRDGYIRTNPSDGVMAEIKKSHAWEKLKRHALTAREQELFVNFTVQSHQYKHWLPLITVMFGTGCRVGEVLGLRWQDCNFEENIIEINHTLIYRQFLDGTCRFTVTTPKTKTGERIIPMLFDVKEALRAIGDAEYHKLKSDVHQRGRAILHVLWPDNQCQKRGPTIPMNRRSPSWLFYAKSIPAADDQPAPPIFVESVAHRKR